MKPSLLAAAAVLLMTPAIEAQTSAVASESKPVSVGGIAGIVRGPDKASVSGATITITRADGNGLWTTISDASGIYSVSNLAPGEYRVTSEADGFSDASVAGLRITAGKATRIDVAMNPVDAQAAPAPAPLSASTNAAPQNTFRRLAGRQPANPRNQAGTEPPVAEPVSTASIGAPPIGAFDRPAAATPDLPLPINAAAQDQPAPTPAAPAVDTQTPFADWDWSWLNGNSRQHDSPLDSKYFSGEFRADTFFGEDFNQPIDHSMGGSSEVFRSGEVQLEDLSIGGDFHDGHLRGRVLALFGMFASTTPRNDASPAVGQWDARTAYRYISEAYGGYHWNVQHGLNVDAGIFVSYVGLFSYHNFDNWAYQPSYVSSNTPWFFNGVRIQWFPTNHLKIEPWIINGWQSYNKYNGHMGLGGQLKWTPKSWLEVIANQYGYGEDNVGLPHRQRYHTDDSIELKYFDKPATGSGIDKMAFTFTGDLGCESGQGVSCTGDKPYNPITGQGGPKQAFLGYMAYNRWWWHHDLFGFTLGGGQMSNPGRYLTLVLPINGADAISGTPYFPAAPGLPIKAYDGTATLDYMPSQFVTFRMEFGYRHTNVPYWSGRGGITPPGGNNGSPQDFACANGSSSGATDLAAAEVACGGGKSSVWFPDLREGQALLSGAIMVKF
jgi:hypothetical protein